MSLWITAAVIVVALIADDSIFNKHATAFDCMVKLYVCFSAVSCAISVIEMVVRNFATLIKTTISGPQPTTVDIAAEERSVNDA